jgi:5'-AMP-activated protein kinase catalytic alpha subunit
MITGEIIANKYKILRQIGSGSFSSVYEAEHIYKGTKVAIKFDTDDVSKALIENEINIYLYLVREGIKNVAGFKSFGSLKNNNYIIMEKLDCTLSDYYSQYYPRKDIYERKKDNLIIFEMLIHLLQDFSSAGLLHRDIKSDNFVFDQNKKLCIIDMGFSKTFDDTKKSSGFIGNILFSSFNVHQSEYTYYPRDDIISLFYMMFYLISSGDLPWSKTIFMDGKEKYLNDVIMNMKRYTDYHQYYRTHSSYEELKDIINLYNIVVYNTTNESGVDFQYIAKIIQQLRSLTVNCYE